jgi:signal transduction histidine kinase
MKQNIEKWQKTGEIKDVEMIILTKEGQRHDVLLSVGAVRDRDGEILYSISVQRDITERKRVEEALKQSHDQLRRLSAHLQSVREEEKGEMAREIHDELGQRLTALQLDLAWLNKRLPDKSEPLEKKMVSMNDLLSSTSQLVDKISASLRPGILDDLGLVPAIEWQVEQFQDTAGIPCELVITPEDFTLDRERSTAIFRILQESLTNVARHAEATNVRITVARTVDRIALEVVDNGKGITEEQISQSTSLGLVGMQERMYTWDGEFKISGRPGKGTTVSVKIPITEDRESND